MGWIIILIAVYFIVQIITNIIDEIKSNKIAERVLKNFDFDKEEQSILKAYKHLRSVKTNCPICKSILIYEGGRFKNVCEHYPQSHVIYEKEYKRIKEDSFKAVEPETHRSKRRRRRY